MQAKPTLMPVLIGLGTCIVGVVNGWIFTFVEVGILREPPENALPVALSMVPGLLGLMTLFTLLLIPAGIGILLHQTWGKTLASSMTLGSVITSGLGGVLGGSGLAFGYGDVMSLFGWGFLTGLVWAICLNLAFKARSMKNAFEATPGPQ